MSQPARLDEAALPLSAARRVDATAYRFERAWQEAAAPEQRPRIDDYLAGVSEAERAALLPELIALEVAYRRKWGEDPRAEDYRQRFPAVDSLRLADALAARAAADLAKLGTTMPRAGAETPLLGRGQRIRCPHCHNPIQLADDRSDEVLCPGCGGSFRLRSLRRGEGPGP